MGVSHPSTHSFSPPLARRGVTARLSPEPGPSAGCWGEAGWGLWGVGGDRQTGKKPGCNKGMIPGAKCRGEDVWKQADGSGWPVCLSCVRGACNICLSQQREQESQEPEWRSTTAKAEWCSALSAPFLPKRVGCPHRRASTRSARTRRITHWEQIRQPSLREGEKNCHFIFVPPPLLLPSFCPPHPLLIKGKNNMPQPVEKRGLNPCQLLVEFIRKRGGTRTRERSE